MATNDELAALLANKLAEMDHMDEDALFSLRWSGGTEPEPLGDAWNMDYLPKGEQLAAVVEQQIRTLRCRYAVVSGWIVAALKVLDTLDPEDTAEADELHKLIKAGEVLALTALAQSKTPNVELTGLRPHRSNE